MTKMATCFSTSPTVLKKNRQSAQLGRMNMNERYVSFSLIFFVLDVFAQSAATLGTFSLPYIYGGDVSENGARPDWFSIANPNVGAKPEDENMFRTRRFVSNFQNPYYMQIILTGYRDLYNSLKLIIPILDNTSGCIEN